MTLLLYALLWLEVRAIRVLAWFLGEPRWLDRWAVKTLQRAQRLAMRAGR